MRALDSKAMNLPDPSVPKLGVEPRAERAGSNAQTTTRLERSLVGSWVGSWMGVVCILAIGVILAVIARYEHMERREASLERFRAQATAKAATTADRCNRVFGGVHGRLRTIARLPGVRAIDREGANLSDDASLTIREISGDLASSAGMSSLHLVWLDHVEFDERNTPSGYLITSFVGQCRDEEEARLAWLAAAPAIQTQLSGMSTRWPSEVRGDGRDYPALCTPANMRAPRAAGVTTDGGLVYSVPLFDQRGNLKGCISAIMPHKSLLAFLPTADFMLDAPAHGYSLSPLEQTGGLTSTPLDRLRSSQQLLFTSVHAVRAHDASASWRLWFSLPNSEFYDSPEVRASDTVAKGSYLAVIALTGVILLVRSLALSRYRLIHERSAELEARVCERTAELELARRAAEAANRAKSDFLANMSHEIRTPMTAILGFADILMEDDEATRDLDRRAEAVQTLRRNGQHLLAIINDILDISKIEAGRMMLECISCSPARIAGEVVSLLRPRATEKSLGLTLAFDGPVPASIHTDPTRLHQVLVNLVSNAIKFTHQGGVEVRLRVEHSDTETSRLHMSVTDTGIGLTPEQIKRIFKPFVQADASMTRRFGGTGLGLAISRRLAELMEGTIDVRSNAGEGTTFSLMLPLQTPDLVTMVDGMKESLTQNAAPARGASSVVLKGRILLAEDGPDNQKLLTFHLRRAGAQVVVAPTGRVAVDLALAHRDPTHPYYAEGEPFALVLMDMQMPELDGYGATALMRSRGYTGPIVALTAHAMASDRERCLKAGCNDYAAKPIERDSLLETCQRWMQQGAAASERKVA